MKNALADKDTAQDKKCEIENEIAEIIEDCQKHLGKDLNYSFGHDVCATFKKFYLPRLNIIKSMLPEYFISWKQNHNKIQIKNQFFSPQQYQKAKAKAETGHYIKHNEVTKQYS